MQKISLVKKKSLYVGLTVSLLFTITFFYGAYFFHSVASQDPADESASGIAMPALLLGIIFLYPTIQYLLVILLHRVTIHDDGVVVTSILGETRKIRWTEVKKVTYNPSIAPVIKITNQKGKSVKVRSRAFSNISELKSILRI